MRETVYVVMGVTGIYSTRMEWPVVGFRDATMAQQYAELAAAAARPLEPNPYDPYMRMEGIDTGYFVLTVPLATTLDPQSHQTGDLHDPSHS